MRYRALIIPAFVLSFVAYAQQYTISTVAGGNLPATPAMASSVTAFWPQLTADAAGDLYFVDFNCVWKIDTQGTLTRIAGSSLITAYSGDGGPATSAQLWTSYSGPAVDSAGNIYIADEGNNVVRKVSTNGTITTIAGNGTAGYTGDGGAATQAELNAPSDVAVDAAGDVFIVDGGNSVIREISASGGLISTVAGNPTAPFGNRTGPATSVYIQPTAIAVDSAGNLYIGEMLQDLVEKVSNGTASIFAGYIAQGQGGYSGDGGPATAAMLSEPRGLAVDASGNVFIADSGNSAVRRVSTSGIITTVAGGEGPGETGDGGPATSAKLYDPASVAVDGAGDLFIGDPYVIREVNAAGTISSITRTYGPGSLQLIQPSGLAVDGSGNLYIADTGEAQICKVSPGGTLTPMTSVTVPTPYGMAADSAGNVYVADLGDNVVRRIAPDGTESIFAGTEVPGFSGDGGPATQAQLSNPVDVAVDAGGNVYIADKLNYVVREVTTDGVIHSVAGSSFGQVPPSTPATMRDIGQPTGVALDGAGNLYIITNNVTSWKVTPSGAISQIYWNLPLDPTAIAADTKGNVYIASADTLSIDVMNPSGVVTQIAGNGVLSYTGDGGPALSAGMGDPTAIAVDASGNVYFSDSFNVVRKLTPNVTAPPPAALSITETGPATITPGQTVTWSVVVTNAAGAGPTSGMVTVTDDAQSMTLVSMSGTGWSCGSTRCTRSDSLAAGSRYPTITVSTTLADSGDQVTNVATVSGGNSSSSFVSADATVVSSSLSAPSLVAPNAAGNVSLTPALSWTQVQGAQSYNVYFGTANPPPMVANTSALTYSPGTLSPLTTYYWSVTALSGTASASSSVTWFVTMPAANQTGDAYFTLGDPETNDSIVVRITDPATIQVARDTLSGLPTNGNTFTGLVVKAPACYNSGWGFHVDPSSIAFVFQGSPSCSAQIPTVQENLAVVGGSFLPGSYWCPSVEVIKEIPAPSCVSAMSTNTSSASHSELDFAPESLATATGTDLANATVPALAGFPNLLGGTSIVVTDSAGAARHANLLSVSPHEVTYVMPAGTANGVAQVNVTSGDGTVSTGDIFIQSTAPALFSADGTGKGLASGWVLHANSNGWEDYEPIAQWNANGTAVAAVPISLGASSAQVSLVLYGTGIRNRSSLAAVTATIGSASAQVESAGAQAGYEGLDQITLLVPHSLAGAGQVTIAVTVDGQALNPVLAVFQ